MTIELTLKARKLLDRHGGPLDLESLFCRAMNRMTKADIDALASNGMSALEVGVDDVAPAGAGYWKREFRGSRAWIIPVYSLSGFELVDLLALPQDRPATVYWRYTGQGVALGYENILAADFGRAPLVLHETPLDWMAAGKTGACIIDWRRYWAGDVAHVSAIRVNNPDFGFEVRKRLSQPVPCPSIQVRA